MKTTAAGCAEPAIAQKGGFRLRYGRSRNTGFAAAGTPVGPPIIQIGTESGLLPAPVVIPSTPVGYEYNRRSITVLNVFYRGLMLGPAERADIMVDFSQFAGKTLRLAEWYVRMEQGEPDTVVNETYALLTFDADGRTDWASTPSFHPHRDSALLASESASLPSPAEREAMLALLFGFMRFTPGPGVGGHCIPLDPFYFRLREQPGRLQVIGQPNQRLEGREHLHAGHSHKRIRRPGDEGEPLGRAQGARQARRGHL